METERLIIRQFKESDLDDMFEYAHEKIVGENAGWKPHESKEETKEILLKHFINATDEWAICLKENKKVIGSIGLFVPFNENGLEIDYALNPRFWGYGYAYEAASIIISYGFQELKTPIIAIGHFPGNERSKKVIEKLGFKKDGVLRKYFRNYDGVLRDYVRYTLLKEEYLEERK